MRTIDTRAMLLGELVRLGVITEAANEVLVRYEAGGAYNLSLPECRLLQHAFTAICSVVILMDPALQARAAQVAPG